MVLNQRLKDLRVGRGFTQKAIAAAIGILPGTLLKFERGLARPKFETLIKLADFFDVSTDYLLGRSNNPARLP
ncbi:MAG: helix-turn-helix transcriptional regulator [Selenomonadaceae bacterium]|nr:helix-turn-helix transcriptional regulator [Selenomonadaceae bacterium]